MGVSHDKANRVDPVCREAFRPSAPVPKLRVRKAHVDRIRNRPILQV